MSRPRSAIAAIVEPGGMAPGLGCGPGRRLASRSPQSALAATGAAVASLAPEGMASIGATVTGAGGAGAEPHPEALTASAKSATITRALEETPRVIGTP